MCTVTFVPRRSGYAMAMNRDEQRTRSVALPPGIRTLEGCRVLSPTERGGGTWIGLNQFGNTLALVNWYSIPRKVSGLHRSRGDVVCSVLAAAESGQVDDGLARWRLGLVNPFRLVGIFPAQQEVIEWRWNLTALSRLSHPWKAGQWISSGFDEPGAQQHRGEAFGRRARQATFGSNRWLDQLHQSHDPEPGPYSTCMHREDAATVSLTRIVVNASRGIMAYRPGSPCERRAWIVATCKFAQAQFKVSSRLRSQC